MKAAEMAAYRILQTFTDVADGCGLGEMAHASLTTLPASAIG
jgi:hypothetical protein